MSLGYAAGKEGWEEKVGARSSRARRPLARCCAIYVLSMRSCFRRSGAALLSIRSAGAAALYRCVLAPCARLYFSPVLRYSVLDYTTTATASSVPSRPTCASEEPPPLSHLSSSAPVHLHTNGSVARIQYHISRRSFPRSIFPSALYTLVSFGSAPLPASVLLLYAMCAPYLRLSCSTRP